MIAMVAMAAVSALVGAMGAIQQGQAQAKSAEVNAQLADNQAAVATSQATANAEKVRREGARTMATAVNNAGGNGVQANGSLLDVNLDSAINNEWEAQDQLYTGRVQSINARNQAAMYRADGSNAKAASWMNAGTTLLTGMSSTLATYEKYKPQSQSGGLLTTRGNAMNTGLFS